MKKLLTLIALMICLTNLKAQFVTIPDANFVAWLQTNVPSAMNGNQMDTTSLAVTTKTTITIVNQGIINLQGIQHFSNLKILNCETNFCEINPNQIANIPSLPSNLITLACGNNLLTNLPALPSSLKLLACTNNPITNLPALPNSLEELVCDYTLINNLPTLPQSLKNLSSSYCQLTNLPILPDSLIFLRVNDNFISNIIILPNNLNYLNCSNNYIQALPILSNYLEVLVCDGNLLTQLPTLPSSLWLLDCHNNNIICFEPFNTTVLEVLCLSENPFTCLPNFTAGMDPPTLAYPLCSYGNPNGCTALTITGLMEQKESIASVYPNPSNGLFTIELSTKEKQNLQLFDMSGNVVLSQTIENGKATIDANYLAAGIYNISIKGNDSVSNKKLVIVK
jgi:hypothetical protein